MLKNYTPGVGHNTPVPTEKESPRHHGHQGERTSDTREHNGIRASEEAWNISGDRPRDVSTFQQTSLITSTVELLEGVGV